MKKVGGEYTIKVKVRESYVSDKMTEQELKDRIKEEGQRIIMAYTSGRMFDPTKKVIQDNVKLEITGV